MPGVGLEPTLPCGKRILSPPRLPFRHPGIIASGFYTMDTTPVTHTQEAPGNALELTVSHAITILALLLSSLP